VSEETKVSRPGSGRRAALVAAALALLVLAIPYLAFLGSHRLWPPYEPELVETAREMRESGDLVVPRLNGTLFSDKPPLYYWTALTAAAAFGRLDEIAARLPSAISALLLFAATAAFGARRFGRRAGLLAGLVLGTMPLCFVCGTAGMCDMPLALTVAGTIFSLHMAAFEGEARGGALVLAALFLGVSVMAKSLMGPALVFLAVVPAALVSRDVRLPRLRWWVVSALAFTAVVVPWFVAVGFQAGRAFLLNLLVHQTFDRFLGRGDSKGNFFSYFGTLPVWILPWTLFVPLVVLHLRRARAAGGERWRDLRFLALGFGLEILFLSVSACRIDKYVLPLLPQLALLFGAAFEGEEDALARRLAAIPTYALAAGLGIGGAVTPIVLARLLATHASFGPIVGTANLGVALGVLAAPVLYVLARRASPSGIALGLGLLLAGALVFVSASVFPAVDEIRTDRHLEEAIVKNVGPDTPYASYGLGTRSFIIFYTRRTYKEFYSCRELDQWLGTFGARPAYVLTRDDYYGQMAADPSFSSRLEVVGRNPPGVGHDDYALVRVRPR
jgi:4-amino-4-deoxy-L-arabinose transferase-like glycosyltransferase